MKANEKYNIKCNCCGKDYDSTYFTSQIIKRYPGNICTCDDCIKKYAQINNIKISKIDIDKKIADDLHSLTLKGIYVNYNGKYFLPETQLKLKQIN